MAKRSFFDRALSALGLGRRNNTVFSGAQGTRVTLDWVATILSADQEIKGNLRMLRARGRELSRNNPIAKNFLNLLVGNVAGPKGISYRPQVRNNDGALATSVNQKIELAFADWAKKGNCTVDGKLSFRAMQDLALRVVAAEGEIFVRFVPGFANKYRFALQLIDADQVDHLFSRPASNNENEIRLGVEVDFWGRPVAYHVSKDHPSDLGGSLQRDRIPAEQMLHLFDPARVSQTRGFTWFHAVMLQLRMLEGYVEAELVAARTEAAKMGFFKYTDPSAYEAPNPDAKYRVEANPGIIETMPPGMEFEAWQSTHPSASFPTFVTTMLRQIATGLGVSYNALASDLVGVNYSSMRSGLLIERDQWKRYQSWLIESFLQPVFEQWLPLALLSGELVLDSRDPRRFMQGKWEPRGWQWVDPLKDAQAAILSINAGLKSRGGVLAEQGEDVVETFEQIKQEKDLAEEMGLEFSTQIQKPNAAKEDGESGTSEDENDPEGKKHLLVPISGRVNGGLRQ